MSKTTTRRTMGSAAPVTIAVLLLLLLAPATTASLAGESQAALLSLVGVGFVLGARASLAAVRVSRSNGLTVREGKGNILILGNGRLASRLHLDLTQRNGSGGRRSHPEPGVFVADRAEVGGERLKQLILNNRVSDVVVSDPNVSASNELTAHLIECKFRGVKIIRAPEFYEELHGKVWLETLQPAELVYSDAFYPSRPYLMAKRLIDLCLALFVLAVTLPLMVLLAVAIKLESPGPIFYRQERVGRFGIPFTLYKFRSMRADAEKNGPMWAKRNDDRVTRIGRFLRRSHLDELPQVFNVLKNDLSFVGPRPERACFIRTLERRIPFFRVREYIKPGITGWAQVRSSYGDSVRASAEKLRYDLYYAKHASVSFDIKVLFDTVWHVAFGRGR